MRGDTDIMKLLVCGTRNAKLTQQEFNATMNFYFGEHAEKITEIVEGCCPDSADVLAEKWAEEHKIKIDHYPANEGNYLKRNIEMLNASDVVLAFWDFFSYGTCHTIAHATRLGRQVIIVKVQK